MIVSGKFTPSQLCRGEKATSNRSNNSVSVVRLGARRDHGNRHAHLAAEASLNKEGPSKSFGLNREVSPGKSFAPQLPLGILLFSLPPCRATWAPNVDIRQMVAAPFLVSTGADLAPFRAGLLLCGISLFPCPALRIPICSPFSFPLPNIAGFVLLGMLKKKKIRAHSHRKRPPPPPPKSRSE